MALISLDKLQLAFGGAPLLENVSFRIEPGERVCVVGRNGEGKSTLLRVVSGEIVPDSGTRGVAPETRIARLAQELEFEAEGTSFDVVAGGIGELGGLIREYHALSVRLADGGGVSDLEHLARVQHRLEAAGGWQLKQRVEAVISRLGLDGDTPFQTLSGGLKRRTLLARALVPEPDLLLLDEPTNHLDLDSIEWLEGFLRDYPGAILFVTHDRELVRRLANRILELDRGCLTDWPGDYHNYLRRKAEMAQAEAKANARFDKRLGEEELWIRKGIQARRTRNEGRVRALEAMRVERRNRRERRGSARIELADGEASGKLVVEARQIGYGWHAKMVVKDFSCTILRGDRVGVIGPNGAGKSTLLNLLLGRINPDTGNIRLGTRLQIAYFDQLREQLDEQKSVLENLALNSDEVIIDGRRRHVMGYLQDFLFTPERVRSPVKSLSGGERNRLLLARLFARPANLLVLDEPTNDLDVETLELLEDRLQQYSGTLLMVSHDRAFLNNVVTSCLVFEGEGRVREYVGGYDDWLRARSARTRDGEPRQRAVKHKKPVKERPSTSPAKLGYKEKRELEQLPGHIEQLEAEIAAIQARMADAGFFKRSGEEIAAVKQNLQHLQSDLAERYARWDELESRNA